MSDKSLLVENLSTLVVRLCRALERHSGYDTLLNQSREYLAKHGLPTGSILRNEPLRACPHAGPHVYCETCKVTPCPLGLDGPPSSIPFERGRTILLTHLEYSDHQECNAQWEQKHPEDNGDLWVGTGPTFFIAAINALTHMLDQKEATGDE